jgi:hypothetical protein
MLIGISTVLAFVRNIATYTPPPATDPGGVPVNAVTFNGVALKDANGAFITYGD